MAGVGEIPPGLTTHSGPFNALSRSQYRALASMRWSIFRNGLRSTHGAMEVGARGVALIFYGLLGVGLGTGLGVASYVMVAGNKWQMLPLLLWIVFALWQVVPVSLASFQEQFDLGGLLRFPVGFGAFYLLHVVFGLIDASTILGGFCCLGIWVGITVTRPGLSAWVALGLVVFAVFNVFLVRAIFAWIDRWLAQRKTREILSAVFLVLLLSVQLVNPALRSKKHEHMSAESRAASLHWLRVANRAQQWLPPGLAAFAMESSRAEARRGP